MVSGPASVPGGCGIFEKAFLVSLREFWGFARNRPPKAVAGWGLHPLESAVLSRRTPEADIDRSRAAPEGCTRVKPLARGEMKHSKNDALSL